MNILFGSFCRILLLLVGVISAASVKDNYVYHGCTGMAWTVLIYIQGVAAILNLIPLPPLDGWGIISPYLSPSCFVKAWLARSSWNHKTMALITFGLIFVMGVATPLLEILQRPLNAMWQLDQNLLASGFSAFFAAFRLP
eukprot:Protomagalhaensia_sp_Gyna_25__5020@NODE_557_length_3126_cov_5_252025_g432_i0_p4_GENE_NODE_557_length_3126_cov_5_252025_g432_i0NODE_557_length_3126_cov_5_252025_g432_i0_p4_ORF_typecomplete_len140_score24_68Peptidase_M50/PF02163_22/1_2e02Peptidase_M50/PF02163_22/0_0058Cytochrom_B561/PF03188_16/6_3Cytochrom_B561/PF03188_16/1_9e02_NODE_557_length_3126_cov_5_252025_g432_i019342353